MTKRDVRAALDAVPWSSLPGDPDDLETFAAGLRAWVDETGYEADEGLDQAYELVGYLSEIPDSARALMELLSVAAHCTELRGRETIVRMIEESIAWAGLDLAERASEILLSLLEEDTDPSVRAAVVRSTWALFTHASPTEEWRRALRRSFEGADDEVGRAAALVGLARAGAASELCERLSRELPEEGSSLVHHAVGLAARLEEAPHPALLRFRDRHGQPGSLRLLFSRLGLPGDPEEILPPFRLSVSSQALERAAVVFAGANIVQVRHPERGPYTLRMPGAGLEKDDPVWLGEFVEEPAKRPLRAKWSADGVEHEIRFGLDGRPVSDV